MNPIQPIEKDALGASRFKANAIVRYLFDHGCIDLNNLATLPFSQDDQEQFAQLIGYSLSAFSELSYVSDDTYGAAELMAYSKYENSSEARIAHLEQEISALRYTLKKPIARLYGIHPDDLQT